MSKKKNKSDANSPIAAHRAVNASGVMIGWIDGPPKNPSHLQSLGYTIEYAYKHANHTAVPEVNRDAEAALLEAACNLRKAQRAVEMIKDSEENRAEVTACIDALDIVLLNLYHRYNYPDSKHYK